MLVEPAHRALLLDVARRSIADHMDRAGGGAPQDCPAALHAHGASFVTVELDDALRGCIGSIVATRALVDDVWSNARRSAFEDPRFAPLSRDEAGRAALEIAVLGPLERIDVDSEEALLAALRPGVDGLLLRLGERRATFLPKVWRVLPDAPQFVRRLKHKMGLPQDFWHDAMEVRRYRTEEFGGPLAS